MLWFCVLVDITISFVHAIHRSSDNPDGQAEYELRAQARRLRRSGQITFLGARADGPALIAGLDVLVVPSLTEGAPLVVLEAMVAGVAIIASAVGGIPDQLGHGQAGILVAPADARALASALGPLLADPQERLRLGNAARVRFAARHRPLTMIDGAEAMYRAML
jgi:glycosyltransferase involved in cell wall biosynthesis